MKLFIAKNSLLRYGCITENVIINLNDVSAFIMISQTKSLTKAAERLGLTTMTVSRRLASLEEELGTRLVHRTTRSVALTDEGEEFLPYAKNLSEAQEIAENFFAPDKQRATGQLRVTAPTGFGRRNMIPLLPAIMEKHPELKIEIQLSDGITDFVGLGYDIAIRIAPLRDSRLIAHRLSDNPRIVYASPEYLSRAGCPTHISDLQHHNCLRLSGVLQWSFITDDHISSLSVVGRFGGNNVEDVRTLCVAGCGLAQLTLWDIQEELISGKLIAIDLVDAQPQMLAVWAIFPTTRHLPTRVNVFLDTLKKEMGSVERYSIN